MGQVVNDSVPDKAKKAIYQIDLPLAPNKGLKELLEPLMPKFQQNYQLEDTQVDDSKV